MYVLCYDVLHLSMVCGAQEDADSTIKPFVHHSHAHREEEAEEDDAEVNLWNLRKCSASGLDVLSTVFNDTLLPVLMPIIQQRLQDADWRARESAVLALGAISEGCSMGLRPHLDEIVTTIMPLLEDPKPLVRRALNPPNRPFQTISAAIHCYEFT
jgi:transportin-1